MTVAASGAGASCLAVQPQQDGSLALVLTALPTVHDLSLSLTEAQSGYDNSPRQTDFNLIYLGVPEAPTIGPVALLDKRTITPTRSDTSPQTWASLFNPADNAPYVIDLETFLGDGSGSEALDTLIGISIDPVAAAMGVMIDSGARRPVIDRTNKRIAVWLKVDPLFQAPTYFTSMVLARVILTFITAGSPVATYRRSGFLQIKQVI